MGHHQADQHMYYRNSRWTEEAENTSDLKLLKPGENHEKTHPRSSTNSMENKKEAHYDQTAGTERQKQKFKAARVTLHIQRIHNK